MISATKVAKSRISKCFIRSLVGKWDRSLFQSELYSKTNPSKKFRSYNGIGRKAEARKTEGTLYCHNLVFVNFEIFRPRIAQEKPNHLDKG